MLPVKYVKGVASDLDAIHEFLSSRDSAETSHIDGIIRDLILAAEGLAEMPFRGTQMQAPRFRSYRQLIVLRGEYRIIYKLRPNDILIFAVFSTRRDLRSAWLSTERKPLK